MEAFGGALIGSGIGAAFQFVPLMTQLAQAATNTYNSWLPTKPPDPQTIMTAWSNRPQWIDKMKTQMRVNGYSKDAISWYIAARDYVIPPAGAVAAHDRGWISSTEKEYIFTQNNILPKWQPIVEKLSQWYPTLADLNLWLIRNVLDPTTVSTYHLDEGQNEQLVNGKTPLEMYKTLGMSDEFAKYEWWATWKMPSFYEAKYMYDWYQAHKDDTNATANGQIHFDLNDFKYAMRTGNWPSFFQNLLTKILTSPPPRVLIGELYQYGIISNDDLPKYYAWSGYHGDLNKKLVEYTKNRYAQGTNRHIKHYTASMVSRLREAGKITADQYKEYMTKLGYHEDVIAVYEKYMQLENQLKIEHETIREVHDAFKADLIKADAALRVLEDAGVDTALANLYVNSWKDLKIKKEKHLTKGEILDFTVNKLLTPQECKQRLEKLGYVDGDIKLIMKYKGIKYPEE